MSLQLNNDPTSQVRVIWESIPEDMKRDLLIVKKSGWSANGMANFLKRSRSSFYRSFPKEFKQSPQSWINEKRFWLANKLLASGIPKKVVAEEVGYHDLSSFVRAYKNFTEYLPRQTQCPTIKQLLNQHLGLNAKLWD